MAELTLGQIVFSKCGRDKGLPFVITKLEGEFAFLADGKLRKLASPKKKKIKHVQPTNYVDKAVGEKLSENRYLLDSDVRKCIRSYRELSSGNKEVKYLVEK